MIILTLKKGLVTDYEYRITGSGWLIKKNDQSITQEYAVVDKPSGQLIQKNDQGINKERQ